MYGSLGATRRVCHFNKFSTSYAFKLQGHNSEDVKINCQIARLNAVAAKLRAEAAELEVDLPNLNDTSPTNLYLSHIVHCT